MYRYQLDNHYERIIPSISVIYLPLSKNGFADILSINLEYTLKLKKSKNKINEIPSNLWEDIKKYTNPYELIYIFNNKREQNIKSIAKFRPLSRSFFKMIEIIHEFIPNINTKNIINSLHIAEGPGGFIEATRFIRRANNNMVINNDRAFRITLIDNYHKNVPAWKQSNIFLKVHPEVIISAGADGTGNIYNIQNILFLETQIKPEIVVTNEPNDSHLIDFITADGGFDYSVDFNNQEESSLHLIFSEICFAMMMQKKGGHFILKVFDTFRSSTIELIYLLTYLYEDVIISKPMTSRPANSEKYIICTRFKMVPNINEIKDRICEMYHEVQSNPYTSILHVELPNLFLNKIREINSIFGQSQISTILSVLTYITLQKRVDKIEQLKKSHMNKCVKWCKKNNMDVHDKYSLY
jgi:23S rRNA U2552 (ribose-2'-O)-methylase RlmE/FtsJ